MPDFNTQTAPDVLTEYLGRQDWLLPGETVRGLSRAGEGNMNVVLRVETSRRSLILKQSRPYVQKYPDIPAPSDRIRTEYRFYQAVTGAGIDNHLPGILGFDPRALVLLLEDLGMARDMTYLYAERQIDEAVLQTLVGVLERIHASEVPKGFPDNLELRRLNHQHIFVLPFLEDNGFSLDSVQEGLSDLARPYVGDERLRKTVEVLGQKYLSRGGTLLHGDYYPGSWLHVSGKPVIIDPEFSFAGFPEFDLGVMAGHLVLATMDPSVPSRVLALYNGPVDQGLVRQVAGTEILRRLIGLAQLPLERSLEEKQTLLETAKNMVLDET